MTSLTPEEAHAAVLAGKTVQVVRGTDPEDPISLHYLDKTWDQFGETLIHTEVISGWSEGIKEAVCDPQSSFYAEHIKDAHEITITDREPFQREAHGPICLNP